MGLDFNLPISLWGNYNSASKLLTEAMGGTANEAGEFAELLAAKYNNAERLKSSTLNVIRS
jgi:hypothetical protein